MQVTPSRLSSSFSLSFLLASSHYPALDLRSFSYLRCRLSSSFSPLFLLVNFLAGLGEFFLAGLVEDGFVFTGTFFLAGLELNLIGSLVFLFSTAVFY
jgi:hypothetical protein